MAWREAHKVESKTKILDAGAKLFCQQGFDAVSIDQVMAEASMTRGAFYAHFDSKVDLYDQSITHGAQRGRDRILNEVTCGLKGLVDAYLRTRDLDDEDDYCPLSFLATDVCHRDESVQGTYTRLLQGYQRFLQEFGVEEARAVPVSVLLVGGLALAKSVNDPDLRKQIQGQCSDLVMELAATTPPS